MKTINLFGGPGVGKSTTVLLQPIFIDGVLLNETTLSEIRSLLYD